MIFPGSIWTCAEPAILTPLESSYRDFGSLRPYPFSHRPTSAIGPFVLTFVALSGVPFATSPIEKTHPHPSEHPVRDTRPGTLVDSTRLSAEIMPPGTPMARNRFATPSDVTHRALSIRRGPPLVAGTGFRNVSPTLSARLASIIAFWMLDRL